MSYRDNYKSIPYFQVNSFTEDRFGGNPAGVCPLSEWPDDQLMMDIAAENKLSETAFFIPTGEDSYHLRWFTPTVEVEFCGHATLASGFVILNILRPDLSVVKFTTRIGELEVKRGGSGFLVINAPSLPGVEIELTEAHLALFDRKPAKVLKSHENFLCVFEGGEEEILALNPNFEAMAKFPEFGFIASAKGTSADFVSRYFAPNHGVPEDPVTGSAHSVLAPYWAGVLGEDRLSARQVSTRGGDLVVEMQGDRVDIWGKGYLLKEGTFNLSKKKKF